MKNWKTTLAGIGAILGGGATVITGALSDPINTGMIMGGITAIAAAIGLLFAKDFNVSNAAHPVESRNVPEKP